ncbi:MAG: FKBP-type peptidyl-prolyl cis-trans isomerase [Bacteroidales bacterium]
MRTKPVKAKYQEYAEKNKLFLEENAKKEGIEILPCGIQYRVIEAGSGVKPTIQSIVQVFYKGKLIDGREFDSNMKDSVPSAFRLREVISGWQLALVEMPVGSKWEIFIPAHLAYGGEAAGIIRKYSTLIFEVDLKGIA